MSVPTLKEAYETSFAVFSQRVRFVEWTMYKVPSLDPHTWMPYYEYTGELLWDTVQEIEGKRWIYAFRSPMDAATLKQATAAKFSPSTYRQLGPARLVDEFFLDENKQLHATPMDKMWTNVKASKTVWAERGKQGTPGSRGAQIPIGTSASFVRQFLGKPFAHYFFASRVQLPSNVIDELQKHIADWLAPITFLPNDPYIFTGYAGQNREPAVPVLDPITIATYLHEYFIRASDDEKKYLTATEDKGDPRSEKEKDNVKRRQKKLLLARIVDSIIENDGTLRDICDQSQLFDFGQQYNEQVQFRIDWRNRWAGFLVNWLTAAPIALLDKAHEFDEVAEIPEFLLHMAHCHFRLSECPEGRELLTEHFTHSEKFAWVHKYFFDKNIVNKKDLWQGIRRLGSAHLEFIKEHAPFFMAGGKQHLMQEALTEMYGVELKPLLIVCGKKKWGWSVWVEESEKTSHMTVGGNEIVGPGEMRFIERHKADLLLADEHHDLTPMWKGAVGGLLEAIELINFAFALQSLGKAGDAELKEKIIAFAELTEAGIHLTHATLELKIFGKASHKTLSKLAFISAAIDVLLGAEEAIESLIEGKLGKALGGGIVTVGSFLVAVGAFSEAGLAGPFGMFIMGIGYFIAYIFRDPTEYENFIHYSAFGKPAAKGNWDGDEEPKWYKTETKFKDWANDYDEQIRAAVMLLCRFRIEPASIALLRQDLGDRKDDAWLAREEERYLTANVEMGWVPKGSKLHLKLSEDWEKPSDSKEFSADLEFTFEDDKEDGKPGKPSVSVSASNGLSVKPLEGGKKLIVTASRSSKPLFDMGDHAFNGGRVFNGINKELKRIILTGSLEVTLQKEPILARPFKDCVLHGKPVSLLGIENEPGEITGGR